VTSRQTTGEADKLVQRYMAQLEAALQGVDASRRDEILAEVHEHIEQGRTGSIPTTQPASGPSSTRLATPLPSPPRQARRPRTGAAGTSGRLG
jgi:hypothetical protein